MSANPYAQFSGVPMSESDIDDLLISAGYGILSLCGDGEPYSIPLSFGYDGEAIYFALLEDSPNPTKLEVIESGATARLLVTDIRGRFDWQSIAVTGPVRQVETTDVEWDHLIRTLDDNGWFISSFEQSDAIREIYGWKLEIDDCRGIERKENVYD